MSTRRRVGDFVGANAIKYSRPSMDGLGAYSRNTGFVSGDVTGTWETLTLEQDRGRRFTVDAMDDEETPDAGIRHTSWGIHTHQGGAGDRRLSFCRGSKQKRHTDHNRRGLDVSTVAAAIDAAVIALDTKEVPEEGRILYATPQIIQALREHSGDKTGTIRGERRRSVGL